MTVAVLLFPKLDLCSIFRENPHLHLWKKPIWIFKVLLPLFYI